MNRAYKSREIEELLADVSARITAWKAQGKSNVEFGTLETIKLAEMCAQLREENAELRAEVDAHRAEMIWEVTESPAVNRQKFLEILESTQDDSLAMYLKRAAEAIAQAKIAAQELHAPVTPR